MQVLQVTAPGKSRLVELPVPQPGPGQVLLKVEAVTTCPQWDLHLRHNEPMFIGHQFNYPYQYGQPGHEAAGKIAAVGAGVTGFAVGDLACTWKDAGHDVPGCYAQYVVHQAEHVLPVPAGLLVEDVAPLELAMCVGSVFLMLQGMGGLTGHTVGVSGLGPAGLVAVQMALAAGASQVIGFDLKASRREKALQLGCSQVFDPRSCPLPVRPQEPILTSAVDCVGASESVSFLMDRTEQAVALFGVQRTDYVFAPHHYNKLKLCGYQGHSRAAAEYALDLVSQKKLDLETLISHRLPLAEYEKGITLLEKQIALKVCYYPWP